MPPGILGVWKDTKEEEGDSPSFGVLVPTALKPITSPLLESPSASHPGAPASVSLPRPVAPGGQTLEVLSVCSVELVGTVAPTLLAKGSWGFCQATLMPRAGHFQPYTVLHSAVLWTWTLSWYMPCLIPRSRASFWTGEMLSTKTDREAAVAHLPPMLYYPDSWPLRPVSAACVQSLHPTHC